MLSDLLLQAPTRAIAVLVWFDMDRNVAHIKSLFIKQTQMEMAGTEEREIDRRIGGDRNACRGGGKA